jgi:tetratricopeptide (TPR) repeat protein
MAKTFYERWHDYTGCLAEYRRKFRTHEETPGHALIGCFRETFRFLGQIIKKPSEEHQAAAHHTQKGVQAYNKKNYQDAEKHFRKAVTEDPTYARGYVYLGNTLYLQRNYEEARTMWEKAIEAEPRSEAADMARDKLARLNKGIHGLHNNPQKPYRSGNSGKEM